MKFQPLNEWRKLNDGESTTLNEGGAAIPDSKRITVEEGQEVFNWVKENVLPKFGVTPNDVEIIGSFGKKRKGEDHGDLDIVIDSNVLSQKNGLEQEPRALLDFMEGILQGMGIQTYKMVGLREISTGIKIPGTEDIAQVDFMLTPSLDWSRFIYHNPNLEKGESQYKGGYRNALLMAVISESKKEVVHDDDEGKEFDYDVVRLPAGIWRTRKTFRGKRGPLKTGKIMREFDKFITTNPQEVVELAVGKGFDPSSIDNFERLWFLIHHPDFIHRERLEEIVEKFKENLDGMGLEPPKEAVEQYPEIFSDKVVRESIDYKEAMEDLADQEHDSWARWMEHLFKKSKKNPDGTVTIPKSKVDRWERQMKTDYEDLSNKEKESDRKEVRKFVKIMKDHED